MSMLAGPRRKQKLSADPRGNNWSKDGSKFGQKMLEKFGWSKGKGLGANEDGNVDHVKISVKNDARGVGCSRNHADNWIAHQDDFNDLLSSLNQDASKKNSNDEDSTDKVTGLESKSKASRSRVHYQKFTKGKDLSSKSQEDMACIFGRRQVKPEADLTPSSEDDSSSSDTENKIEHGVITVRSTDSVQGYFAKKMAEKRASMTSLNDKSEDEERPSFSRDAESFNNDADENKSVKKKVRFSLGDNEEVYSDTLITKKKKSKKKRKNKDDEKCTEETSDTTEDSNQENCEEGCDNSEDKSKKKRKRSSESQADEEAEVVKRKKTKKNRKEKITNNLNGENSVKTDEINSIDTSDQMEWETGVKEELLSETRVESGNEDEAKSKKKKKSKKVKDDVCEDDSKNKPWTNNTKDDSIKTKRKKKKRKHMPIVD